MAMFGNSGRETYDALYSTLQQPADVSALEREQAPGAFEGSIGEAVIKGAQTVGQRAGIAALQGARAAPFPQLQLYGIDLDEQLKADIDEDLRTQTTKMAQAIKNLKLDPKTNGMAAQLVHGVVDVLGTVGASALTGYGAPMAAYTYGISQAEAGKAEGLDPLTAYAKGAIEGGAMGVSVALPAALTGGLAFRTASGAALNVGVGIPERLAVSTLLNSRGYSEMARQYAPLDSTAIATELVLGAAFGGLLGPRAKAAKLPPPEAVPPSAVDAALVANQQAHAEIDVAPGVPIDTRTRQAHTAAMNQAVESMVMGRDVNVESLLKDAGFLGKRPDFDALRVIADELDKAGAADLVAQVRALEAEAQARGLVVEPDTLGSVVLSDKVVEQAKVDAERLGDFRAFEFSEDGDLNLAANMPFIRSWVAEMPQNQRAAIMDADGRLSAEGAGRLRNAILYRAYGDSPTLSRLVEATDPGSRNIAAALTRSAPAVADAREAIARGDMYPMGLHDDLVSAVEKLDSLRRIGMTAADWTKQIDAFGDGMTPEARLLVQFMDQNIRSTRVISDGVFGFYNRLLEAGNPKQGSMFEAAQPDKMRMLTLALDGQAPIYARGEAAGSTVADLTTALRAQFGRDSDRLVQAGRIKFVESADQLPAGPHPADVRGMYYGGDSYIVAGNTPLSAIRGLALHEIGIHAGFRDMLGDALYNDVLARIEAKIGTDPVFAEARALAEARANRPDHVPEETLAYLIENAPEMPLVRRVLAAIRQWLYRVSGGRFVDLTQADLQMMAVASLRRYARMAEVEARGENAPFYMTLFHGSPTAFKPESDAPLGRLRWKYINTGEGAQAFGYGHYLAQQEWIARTRYRDRLVERRAKQAQLQIPYPGDPTATFVIDDSTGPGYRVGDSIVHPNMDGALGGIGWAIREIKNTGDVEQVREWAEADLADDRVKLEAYRRGNMNQGSLMRVERQIEYWEAALRALDELTVEGVVGWLVKFQEDYNGRMAEQISQFKTRSDAENYLANVLNGNGRIEEAMGRVPRQEITEVKPEPPKGALYGKFIPDETWDQMMIWDAPMDAQPAAVQEFFNRLQKMEDDSIMALTADDAYSWLSRKINNGDYGDEFGQMVQSADYEVRARRVDEGADPAELDYDPRADEIASVMMHMAGIPGHRFLDGETRAAGWDSPEARFNVVLYSDDLGRVAWEAKDGDTRWETANGRGVIEKMRIESLGRDLYIAKVDGEDVGQATTIEEATRLAEQALDGQLYSRGATMEPDPIKDTTLPDARLLADQADAEIATATELSQGFIPAVECALRVGA